MDLLEVSLSKLSAYTNIAPYTSLAIVFALIFFGFASRVLSELKLVNVIRTLDLIALLVMGTVYLIISAQAQQSVLLRYIQWLVVLPLIVQVQQSYLRTEMALKPWKESNLWLILIFIGLSLFFKYLGTLGLPQSTVLGLGAFAVSQVLLAQETVSSDINRDAKAFVLSALALWAFQGLLDNTNAFTQLVSYGLLDFAGIAMFIFALQYVF